MRTETDSGTGGRRARRPLGSRSVATRPQGPKTIKCNRLRIRRWSPSRRGASSPPRRQFTAEYRLRVVEEADRCTRPGEVGRMLRREGLYTSHLSAWRKARRSGSLQGLTGKKRGAKPAAPNPLSPKRANRCANDEINSLTPATPSPSWSRPHRTKPGVGISRAFWDRNAGRTLACTCCSTSSADMSSGGWSPNGRARRWAPGSSSKLASSRASSPRR